MKIAIIGAGAMGSVYGGLLAKTGHEVWLVDVWREHIEAIRANDLRVDTPGGTHTVKVNAVTHAEETGAVDWVIVFVKSYHTASAIAQNSALFGDETTFLTLQNGHGNLEAITEAVGDNRAVGGVSYISATVHAPGHVEQTSGGKTVIGELNGERTNRIQAMSEVLETAGFSGGITEDIQSIMWGKLIVNIMGNALSAVTGLTSYGIAHSPDAKTMMKLVGDEAANVANALGIQLPYDDPAAYILDEIGEGGPGRASMLQDVDRKRRTEIDAMNGVIVREGERLGIPVPYNRAMTHLVRATESGYLGEDS